MNNDIKDILYENGLKVNINLDKNKLDLFQKYKDILIEWNNKINLTAITKNEEIVVKHFLDSILLINYFNIKDNSNIIDIGTGAGFPSVPLKIFNNSLNITLVDSLNKRINFLNQLILYLNLNNIHAIHSRAENLALNLKYRENYDYVVARAVSKLRELVEYCLPFIKIGGYFLAYKGYEIEDEIDEALYAIKILGGEIQENVKYSILEEHKRSIIVIKKISQTPTKFPRNKSKILKQPLK